MSERSKLLSLLGLAKKAGRISLGHDAVLEAIKKKRAKVILLAGDASPRLEKEMHREKEYAKSDIPVIRIQESMAQIYTALPQKAGVISVNDESFAGAIQKVIEEG